MSIPTTPVSPRFLARQAYFWHFITEPSSEISTFAQPHRGARFEDSVERIAQDIQAKGIPGVDLARAASDRPGDEANLLVRKTGRTGALLCVHVRITRQGDSTAFEIVRSGQESLKAGVREASIMFVMLLLGLGALVYFFMPPTRLGRPGGIIPFGAFLITGYTAVHFYKGRVELTEATKSDLRTLQASIQDAIRL